MGKIKGKFRKRAIQSAVAFTALLSAVAVQIPTYAMNLSDVSSDGWYYNYVEYVVDNGLMTGYENGNFGPADKLTRGQFATILYRMSGSPEVAYEDVFPDVEDGMFYSDPIVWANQNGLITGYSDSGKFGPNDYINREQMATIFYRYAPFIGEEAPTSGDIYSFPDGGNVNDFAKDGMSYAIGKGLIKGDNGYINPQNHTERAQVATIITRFVDPEYEEAKKQEAIQAKWNEGSFGFFEYYNLPGCIDILNTRSFSEYTKKGDPQDATSLENMLASIDYMKQCNEIRKANGLHELKVMNSAMAISQVQANAADVLMRHPLAYGIYENLAWGPDPFYRWYDMELEEIKNGNTNWHEVGHYYNLLDEDHFSTGFAICTRAAGNEHGWEVYEQSFFPNDEGCTVEEYEAKLLNYIEAVKSGNF